MLLRCNATAVARVLVCGALFFLFPGYSCNAQDDTFASLSAEANTLSAVNDAVAFAATAADILSRADAVLSGSELQSVQDAVGGVAATWLQQTGLAASLDVDAAAFLVAQGLTRVDASQQADVATAWLLESGAVSRLSADTINRLSQAAGSQLTDAQRQALLSESREILGEASGISFDDLKEHIDVRTAYLYPDTENGRVAKRQIVVDWADSRDPASLPIDQVDWAMMAMLPKWMSEYPPQEIDATWQARIIPPRSGEYMFGLSPHKLSATREEGDAQFFRQWMTIEVDGQKVLEAQPGDWQQDGTPVRLAQGQPATVKVTLRYRMRGYVPLPAAGQLYWSGPGIAKQIVGAAFYSLPNANEPGVRLAVSRRNGSGQYSCETTVDSIDQIIGKHAICTHEQTLQRYIDQRLDDYLSPSFMNQAVAKASSDNVAEREPHPFTFLPDYRGIVNKASSTLRRRIANEFALRPEVFGPLDVWTMVYFHDAVRFGAEREALDMLGAWMTIHASDSPELVGSTREFFDVNRAAYRHLIIPLVLEHAESAEWLEEDYLEMEDGTCCLSVATVVAYCHLVSGRMLEWIEKLDARLGDASVAGDRRVSWLIARAVAEEIRTCPQDHKHYPGCHRIGAGFGWLDEAMLVAKTPNVKELAGRERVARLVALGKWDAAEAALEGNPGLGDLQARLSLLRSAAALEAENQAAAADAAVLAEMRRRRARANARGDTASADKYLAIIERLERK